MLVVPRLLGGGTSKGFQKQEILSRAWSVLVLPESVYLQNSISSLFSLLF